METCNPLRIDDHSMIELHSNSEKMDSNLFQNPESLKKARQMLEIVEEKKYIPPNKAGLVIGTGGVTVKEIIRKTQVVNFIIFG